MRRVFLVSSCGDKRMTEISRMLLDNGEIVIFNVENRSINSGLCKILPPNIVATDADGVGLFEGDLLFCGKMEGAAKERLGARKIKVYEMLKDADFVERNANLTAEAAMQSILVETEESLSGKSVLICGCGRIGKRLAVLMTAFGAEADVLTSRTKANAVYGRTISKRELRPEIYDYVLNTAPNCALGKEFLKKLKKDVKCFELASKPYGFDFAAAKEPGIKIVGLPALPAKIKAKEAAKIMLDYVEGVL